MFYQILDTIVTNYSLSLISSISALLPQIEQKDGSSPSSTSTIVTASHSSHSTRNSFCTLIPYLFFSCVVSIKPFCYLFSAASTPMTYKMNVIGADTYTRRSNFRNRFHKHHLHMQLHLMYRRLCISFQSNLLSNQLVLDLSGFYSTYVRDTNLSNNTLLSLHHH